MKKTGFAPLFLIIFILGLSSLSGAELKVGEYAPDFTLPYASQDTINFDGVTLSHFQNRSNVVLVFYFADWSPNSREHLATFQDNVSDFTDLDSEIWAISGDYVYSHRAWIDEQGFQFKLVSDHLHKVSRMYESYQYRITMNKRTVFVIDKEGKISYINLNYNPENPRHFSELRDHLSSLEEEQ